MPNRTLQFHGQGFGSVPVTITVTANNNIIYQGPINTVNQPMPGYRYPQDQMVLLFDLEVPLDYVGTFPMTVAVESGTGMLLGDSEANYSMIPNSIYTPEQIAIVTNPDETAQAMVIFESLANPPLSQSDIDVLSNPASTESECDAILAQHGLSIMVSSGFDIYDSNFCINDARANVTLDGEPVTRPVTRPPGFDGDWTRVIPAGSTLGFDFIVEFAGVE